jgi:hypothetical protein
MRDFFEETFMCLTCVSTIITLYICIVLFENFALAIFSFITMIDYIIFARIKNKMISYVVLILMYFLINYYLIWCFIELH